jgi:hypothetical protein
MNPDMPFTFAQRELKDCVGYLRDAIAANTLEERYDALDGAKEYGEKVLNILHDAAYYEEDIGTDVPGIRQPEVVRHICDTGADAAYTQLEELMKGFLRVDVESVSLNDIPVDAIASAMSPYESKINEEKEFQSSLPEPDY